MNGWEMNLRFISMCKEVFLEDGLTGIFFGI